MFEFICEAIAKLVINNDKESSRAQTAFLEAIEEKSPDYFLLLFRVLLVHCRELSDYIMIFQYEQVTQINHVKPAMEACIRLTKLEHNDLPEITKEVYKDLRVVATMFKKELVAHIKDQHKTVANSIRDLEALEPFLTVALQSDPYQRQKYQVEDFSSVKFQKVLKRFVPEGKEREISEELIKYKELLPVLALNPPPNREEIASYSAAKKLALAKQRDPAGWWKLNRDVLPVLSAAVLKLFAIVPSTAGAERSHAQTKLLISAQQTRMDPNLINMMRVIKHNLKFFYPSLAEDDVDEDEDD